MAPSPAASDDVAIFKQLAAHGSYKLLISERPINDPCELELR